MLLSIVWTVIVAIIVPWLLLYVREKLHEPRWLDITILLVVVVLFCCVLIYPDRLAAVVAGLFIIGNFNFKPYWQLIYRQN